MIRGKIIRSLIWNGVPAASISKVRGKKAAKLIYNLWMVVK